MLAYVGQRAPDPCREGSVVAVAQCREGHRRWIYTGAPDADTAWPANTKEPNVRLISTSKNTEIMFRWQSLCIQNDAEWILPQIW